MNQVDSQGLSKSAVARAVSLTPMSGTDEGAVGAARRPKLIFLASSFPYGRNDTFFGPEVRELVRQGVDVLVIPVRPRGSATTPESQPLALHKPLLDREILSAALTQLLGSPRATVGALISLLRSPRPSVLLRNLAAFPKALWVARIARTLPADHIHAHWAGPPSTVAMVASQLSGVPWSFTAHATEIYAGNLLRAKCRSARFVRFVSTAMMERARSVAPGVDDSRWELLRLGIDVPEVVGPHPPNHPSVLLLTASFVRGKGHEVALAAVKRLLEAGEAAQIWLAGGGPLEAEVRSRAHHLGIAEAVRFHGYVPNARLLDWLAAGRVDVVVLPSDAEGLPVSLVEALARGVPAVASDVGGVAELLGDGCGVLVPPRDPKALADALVSLLRSPERRAGYAQAGRKRVEQEFAVAPVVRRLRALLGFGDAV
jgi:colanic acid/amylovoran biosynthesis glycosyltransferase